VVRFREQRSSIRLEKAGHRDETEQNEENKYVELTPIDRTRYPKVRAWYILLIFFLGFLYLLARFLFKG
jgi:hypothetical protein